MRFRKPSPSMLVALVALAMASTGTAVAAVVNFARNAGAVDHRSAVPASAGKARAAGKLVATRAKGADTGKLPNRFLARVPYTGTFERGVDVADNSQGSAFTLGSSRLGKLTATCEDQRPATGTEDPKVTFSFANATGGSVNFARDIGGKSPEVKSVVKGGQGAFTINGSNTFQVQVESKGVNSTFQGQVRQDGAATANARCFVAGTIETITP
jgi:hypothetical protein